MSKRARNGVQPMKLIKKTLVQTSLCLVLTIAVCGCMNPYYGGYPGYGYGGYGYNQPTNGPAYAPTPGFGTAPGSLVIPENQTAPYDPGTGSTFEQDDFQGETEGPFFRENNYPGEDAVPLPRNRDRDFGPSTRLDRSFREAPAFAADDRGGVSLVGGYDEQAEYGWDTADYRNLRGVVSRDRTTGEWRMRYSLFERDAYGGVLPLRIPSDQVRDLQPGDNVVVEGVIDASAKDATGRPLYRVDSIFPLG